MNVETAAKHLLRRAVGNEDAEFHAGQLESIQQLVDRKRVLVVQRTGWGKSMVYFVATKLMRDLGRGMTLIVSPLLALMRNQIAAAQKVGLVAKTINSNNTDDWEGIFRDVLHGNVDLLIVSPERLSNDEFRQNVLMRVSGNLGLFVVDEAHCISDWGHDFRPDYKQIVRIIDLLPQNVAVLATTATANDRVVEDISAQMGENLLVQRGSLARKSLQLQNMFLNSQSERLAWLADNIPHMPGCGIVYTLTQKDAENVAEWLNDKGIVAEAYHAGIDNDGKSVAGFSRKEYLENRLLRNEVKVLVATVALGMGFDKPDVAFVIHFQRPSSVVHYYQQVGRAGRAIQEAKGILMCGAEDDRIAEYFIESAFPPQEHISKILRALMKAEDGLKFMQLLNVVNIPQGAVHKAFRIMNAESPSPVMKVGSTWFATPTATNYKIDEAYIEGIKRVRRAEQREMQKYMSSKECLMSFLRQSLDDPHAERCHKCANCSPEDALPTTVDNALVLEAKHFLRTRPEKIKPRTRWPKRSSTSDTYLKSENIPKQYAAEEGRVLCQWRDAGWGNMVADGKFVHNHFPDELVQACARLVQQWQPNLQVEWLTYVPSLRRPTLVSSFAQRLASELGIPFVRAVEKVEERPEQNTMQNSFQQQRNLMGAFRVGGQCPTGPCLLVDDTVDSRWTFTAVTARLRQAGCSAVFPLALAQTTRGQMQ